MTFFEEHLALYVWLAAMLFVWALGVYLAWAVLACLDRRNVSHQLLDATENLHIHAGLLCGTLAYFVCASRLLYYSYGEPFRHPQVFLSVVWLASLAAAAVLGYKTWQAASERRFWKKVESRRQRPA